MHGIQLCTASVKVLWLKLFPEDTHEVEDDMEDVGEIFPVQIAVGNETKYSESTLRMNQMSRKNTADEEGSIRSGSADSKYPGQGLRVSHPGRGYGGQLAGEEGHGKRGRSVDSFDNLFESGHPGNSVKERSRSRSPQTIGGQIQDNRRDSRIQTGGVFLSRETTGEGRRPALFTSEMQQQWDDRAAARGVSKMNVNTNISLQGSMGNRSQSTNDVLHRNADLKFKVPAGLPKLTNIMNAQALLRSKNNSINLAGEPTTSRSVDKLKGKTRVRTADQPVSPPGTATRPSTPTSSFEEGRESTFFGEEGYENPLTRTLLRSTALNQGHKLTQLTRRQTTETVNMKSVSPLMQEYFVSSVLAPVKMNINSQMLHRTVPVSWCATGGQDTHRKRVIHTDLHQDITDRRITAEKDFMKASYLGKKHRLESLRNINQTCSSVLRSDSATIGRFSLDLVKRQQQQRKSRTTGPKGDFAHAPPIEAPSNDLLSTNDANLAANFDPADLDQFLASI
eukprot:CAMPEP_0119052528 /NCGR_PEP_ID=MMETSP1177-20130426/73795_1 /TAXON_ID=2985 /ORGANISM="Ochromonas sp, Strain CCMP1899" /LENGTH=507 /DNA_ID=CAMNT_0007032125 /DNA_START=1675 /DNA_END=3198 /DNA_ORIENTATION=-